MLTNAQEKLIKSLQTKKGRVKTGLCLVEGQKVIELASDYIEYSFGPRDSEQFQKLVTTETPQAMAGVAKIPEFSQKDILSRDIIIVLDGVQDPGNVGSILRLCLGFKASLIIVESADVTSPKVIRSSVGAMFKVPWLNATKQKVGNIIKDLNRPVYRLEKTTNAIQFEKSKVKTPLILLVGSEGHGIKLKIKGTSIYLKHDKELESLNVGQAVAITLYLSRTTF